VMHSDAAQSGEVRIGTDEPDGGRPCSTAG